MCGLDITAYMQLRALKRFNNVILLATWLGNWHLDHPSTSTVKLHNIINIKHILFIRHKTDPRVAVFEFTGDDILMWWISLYYRSTTKAPSRLIGQIAVLVAKHGPALGKSLMSQPCFLFEPPTVSTTTNDRTSSNHWRCFPQLNPQTNNTPHP